MSNMVSIKEEVAQILRAAKIEGNTLFLRGQLSRDMYQAVNKAIELLGGKWNRKAQGHVFPGNPKEMLDTVLSDGKIKIENKKKKFQLFETPIEIAEKLVSMTFINNESRILEPSAGTGRIADAIMNLTGASLRQLHFCEIQPELSNELSRKGYTKVGDDFLQFFPLDKYSIIIMNPPFTNGQDIDHVMHAYTHCLAEGGELVAIISPSFQFREQKKFSRFREFVKETGAELQELHGGAFKESGTNIKTVIVKINK